MKGNEMKSTRFDNIVEINFVVANWIDTNDIDQLDSVLLHKVLLLLNTPQTNVREKEEITLQTYKSIKIRCQ